MRLDPKHREILEWLAARPPGTECVGVGARWEIDAEAGVFSIRTLRAMERRGWITLNKSWEGAIHSSDKPFTVGHLTDEGRGALHQADSELNEED